MTDGGGPPGPSDDRQWRSPRIEDLGGVHAAVDLGNTHVATDLGGVRDIGSSEARAPEWRSVASHLRR